MENARVMNNSIKLTAEQAIEQCLPIILKTIRQLESTFHFQAGDLLNDFLQDGNLAVLKALERYDASRDVEFTTYAYYDILGDLNKAFKAERSRGQDTTSIDIYDSESGEFIGTYFEHIPADPIYNADYTFTSKAQREDCEWLLRRVKDETDRRIVRLSFGLEDGFEHSNEAIGFELGCSAERVRQRLNRAMAQLQGKSTDLPLRAAA